MGKSRNSYGLNLVGNGIALITISPEKNTNCTQTLYEAWNSTCDTSGKEEYNVTVDFYVNSTIPSGTFSMNGRPIEIQLNNSIFNVSPSWVFNIGQDVTISVKLRDRNCNPWNGSPSLQLSIENRLPFYWENLTYTFSPRGDWIYPYNPLSMKVGLEGTHSFQQVEKYVIVISVFWFAIFLLLILVLIGIIIRSQLNRYQAQKRRNEMELLLQDYQLLIDHVSDSDSNNLISDGDLHVNIEKEVRSSKQMLLLEVKVPSLLVIGGKHQLL
jgi:hypothetical protein